MFTLSSFLKDVLKKFVLELLVFHSRSFYAFMCFYYLNINQSADWSNQTSVFPIIKPDLVQTDDFHLSLINLESSLKSVSYHTKFTGSCFIVKKNHLFCQNVFLIMWKATALWCFYLKVPAFCHLLTFSGRITGLDRSVSRSGPAQSLVLIRRTAVLVQGSTFKESGMFWVRDWVEVGIMSR